MLERNPPKAGEELKGAEGTISGVRQWHE